MNGNASFAGLGRFLAASLPFWASGLSLIGTEVTITRTNWAERWITNVIDMRMPVNRFVNEYHTNWVTQLRTNVVDVSVTNWVMRQVDQPGRGGGDLDQSRDRLPDQLEHAQSHQLADGGPVQDQLAQPGRDQSRSD